jgi:hypothetical protein
VTVTATSFLQTFPEFADSSTYTPGKIAFWLAVATTRIDPSVWDTLTDQGVQLYMAHNLALDGAAKRASDNGTLPGQATGALASKSAGGLGAGYDTGSSAEAGAGQFNATTYGQRYFELMQMFGAGGLSL